MGLTTSGIQFSETSADRLFYSFLRSRADQIDTTSIKVDKVANKMPQNNGLNVLLFDKYVI